MEKDKRNKISSGSYDLNKWLHGGYEKDVITMIAGSPGSGKTNFSTLVACSQAKKGNKALFIDTEGGFSSERVEQIVGEEQVESILENIILLNPTSFKEQREAFDKLNEKIKSEHVGVIVVDGMAMLYRLELGDAVKSGEGERIKETNREVARQMRILAEIARKQNIPVMITNQVYSEFLTQEDIDRGFKKDTNIVGGDLFKYWSKCIIELKNERGKRRAVLLKHRSIESKSLNFEIHDKGVFKKGLF
ncbi:MAG: DNA repair and recombination protein RadB [Candidatus Pacearchaeota archaeon]